MFLADLHFFQDFETLSVKSTARDESGGKLSPLEDERKRKAELLATAAERWVLVSCHASEDSKLGIAFHLQWPLYLF